MAIPRKYTVSEVKELVEFFRDDPDISPEKFSGMIDVVQLLAHYENMTDEEVEAEVRSAYRRIHE